jgi:uncharacterized RDD family membrane protein YckC
LTVVSRNGDRPMLVQLSRARLVRWAIGIRLLGVCSSWTMMRRRETAIGLI